jgi:hypothetical protein
MKKLPILLIMFFSASVLAENTEYSNYILSLDFPTLTREKKMMQRLSYESPVDTFVLIRINSFYIQSASGDSVNLYDLSFEKIHLKKGAGYIDLPFSKAISTHKMHNDFFETIKKFNMVPAGNYKTNVEIYSLKEPAVLLFEKQIEQYADSNLSYSSGLRDKMNAAISISKSARQKAQNKISGAGKLNRNEEQEMGASEKKLKRNLKSVKGLDMRTSSINGKKYSETYYKGFFLGRYEMASVHDLNNRADAEQKKLSGNSSALVNNELEGFSGVGSQLKDLNTKKDKETRLNGIVDINSFRATAQDPQSATEQNYTEFLLGTDVELMGVPVSIEAFYTTQDANRKAKASYFRFHYDVESAKNKLQKTIDAYKSKLEETGSKGQGLESIYGNYAKSLEGQKTGLLYKMAREYEIDPKTITDNNGDVDKIISSIPDEADTSKIKDLAQKGSNGKQSKASEKKQKLQKNRKDVTERYRQIVALQERADKYYKLLENYRTKTHLDSAINYKKMAGLEEQGDPTYKDMSKAAVGILPEGKTKNFITGLTNFDAGIINKYESQYTMAGQTTKGVSLGYDLGLCKAGITVGNTEYISREGNVDHYSQMLLRLDNKGSKKHKVGMIYNLTTPAKSMGSDENFIGKQNIRYPGFSHPTQVVSLLYDGKITKRLTVQSELASSFKKDQATSFDMAHAATTNTVDYAIPGIPVNVSGTWEHLGNSFENNTLPYIRSGTERYTLSTAADLFRSFLSLKVDYNYLVQENFSTTSYNRKWGFDAKTHSKRYPNVSLSYKPFSTFRSYADTLQIAQRPVQGEVWTARASYQIKRNKQVHRFTVLYNKNSSTADTVNYSSSIAQLAYVYSNKDLNLTLSLSKMDIPGNFADGTGMISSYMTTVAFSKAIGKYLNVMVSPDVAFCGWGVQRKSGTVGVTFKVPGKPIQIRSTFRYSNYKLNEAAVPLELYAGNLGMNWQFQLEKKNKVVLK